MGSCVHVFCKSLCSLCFSIFNNQPHLDTDMFPSDVPDSRGLGLDHKASLWSCCVCCCTGGVPPVGGRTAVWRSEFSKPPFLPVLWTRLGFHLSTQHHVSSPACAHAPSGLRSHTEKPHGCLGCGCSNSRGFILDQFPPLYMQKIYGDKCC